jgi:hypothetical protein
VKSAVTPTALFLLAYVSFPNPAKITAMLRIAAPHIVAFTNTPPHINTQRKFISRTSSRAMPCYLFTYHAYGSWMPDHPRGYVQRGQGILPPDRDTAQLYRAKMSQETVRFTVAVQETLIPAVLHSCECQQLSCHFIATETTHVHILLSWRTPRTWQLVRKQLSSTISRRLNEIHQRQIWFSKSPSRKRVKDRDHFDYLMATYLPKHSGWKWVEGEGPFK